MSAPVAAHWRSAVLGCVGLIAVVAVALFAPGEHWGEAYTAIAGIVSVVVIRHSGQDRDRASP